MKIHAASMLVAFNVFGRAQNVVHFFPDKPAEPFVNIKNFHVTDSSGDF
jgi:hypothetical protein